jgi:hypothetical protein
MNSVKTADRENVAPLRSLAGQPFSQDVRVSGAEVVTGGIVALERGSDEA